MPRVRTICLLATARLAATGDLCHDTSLHRVDGIPPEQLIYEKSQYWGEGYVVVRGMFKPEEMEVVKQVVDQTAQMQQTVATLRNSQAAGNHPSFATIFVWNDVVGRGARLEHMLLLLAGAAPPPERPVRPARQDGADIFAKVGKSHKVLDRLSCFYHDDVYDYHNKITLKYPGIVGFRPHQDYWYWHNFGVKYPEASAVYIAIDEATVENGCLQVVPRSHLLGLLNHSHTDGRGNDDTGVEWGLWHSLLARGYAPLPVPLAPGDAIFFTGQTIHASADNNSNKSRVAMIATMNTRHADPDPKLNVHGHPFYSHQRRVEERITAADTKLPLPDFHYKWPVPAEKGPSLGAPLERHSSSKRQTTTMKYVSQKYRELQDKERGGRGVSVSLTRTERDTRTERAPHAALATSGTRGRLV
eukprot:4673890-Prymnesium_polylepis.1